jgi:hypothetical protein
MSYRTTVARTDMNCMTKCGRSRAFYAAITLSTDDRSAADGLICNNCSTPRPCLTQSHQRPHFAFSYMTLDRFGQDYLSSGRDNLNL